MSDKVKYLFLVPHEETGGWQTATHLGRVIVTTGTRHFSERMPLIVASEFLLDTAYDLDAKMDADASAILSATE